MPGTGAWSAQEGAPRDGFAPKGVPLLRVQRGKPGAVLFIKMEQPVRSFLFYSPQEEIYQATRRKCTLVWSASPAMLTADPSKSPAVGDPFKSLRLSARFPWLVTGVEKAAPPLISEAKGA